MLVQPSWEILCRPTMPSLSPGRNKEICTSECYGMPCGWFTCCFAFCGSDLTNNVSPTSLITSLSLCASGCLPVRCLLGESSFFFLAPTFLITSEPLGQRLPVRCLLDAPSLKK